MSVHPLNENDARGVANSAVSFNAAIASTEVSNSFPQQTPRVLLVALWNFENRRGSRNVIVHFSVIARVVFSPVVTSTPSERVFSEAETFAKTIAPDLHSVLR